MNKGLEVTNFSGVTNLDQLIRVAEKEESIEDTIIDFFSKNDGPPDSDFHALADKLGIDPDKLETQAYKLITSFFAHGKSKDFKGTYDKNEEKMGIEVEQEHTNNPKMALRICHDHLAEIPDYYTRLKKMEDEAKQGTTDEKR